jgi:signal peptidase I
MDSQTTPTKTTPAGKQAEKESLGELIRTLGYAVLFALGLRSFLYEPFNIPSESMLPNLLVGDYLFVSKFAYGYSRYSFPFGLRVFDDRVMEKTPARGDVAVFKWPHDNDTDYIKRIIGLPGDQIQVRDGVLQINGEPVKRERAGDFRMRIESTTRCSTRSSFGELDQGCHNPNAQYCVRIDTESALCRYPRFRETLPNAVSYYTIDMTPFGPRDNTEVFLVPAGHFFAMGDNRDNSSDSRVPSNEGGVGFVPAENLVGRAEVIFFSTDGTARLWTPWLWFSAARFDRLFDAIR